MHIAFSLLFFMTSLGSCFLFCTLLTPASSGFSNERSCFRLFLSLLIATMDPFPCLGQHAMAEAESGIDELSCLRVWLWWRWTGIPESELPW